MIDKCWIGRSFPKLVVDVEKGQLRFFAKAAGEKNPVYTDEVAALEAGYRSLPGVGLNKEGIRQGFFEHSE